MSDEIGPPSLRPFNIIEESMMTGEPTSFEEKFPREAALALEMVCMGCDYSEIKAKTNITVAQLSALRARHETAIEVRRKQLAIDGFDMAESLRILMKEKIRLLSEDTELLKKTPLVHLATSWGIAQTKGFEAAEGNRTIVEHVQKRATLADAQKMIEDARKHLMKEAIPIDPKT